MGSFGVFAFAINKRVITAKFIRSLYFVEKRKKDQPKFNIRIGNSSKQTNSLLTIKT